MMEMSDYRIRAHHGMCLAFFEGKGYNSEFTAHMGEMKKLLEKNPVVELVTKTDDICAGCQWESICGKKEASTERG